MNVHFFETDTHHSESAGLLQKLSTYGPKHSVVIETLTWKGESDDSRALIFVFHEPESLMDITVLVFPSCYRFPDSTAGAFYCQLRANLGGNQHRDLTAMDPSYLRFLANKLFGENLTLSERRDNIASLLSSLNIPARFLPAATDRFKATLNPWK